MEEYLLSDLQFKNDLRKELLMYKDYLELLDYGLVDKLRKKFLNNIDRIQETLQEE